ncbi:alcohol dehydrogenase catalytic domain-containing protein [Lapidilactobacillus luobeiensis]|uniref:alcohol dehydrogenase catalytic domain-containing protein n=1 Tax=Lapidilactobacillus luobeiensis TaxID=2950371 RepID=UPI0021C39862|nr:alcohol dehydrogenase catalytic domain-containing protein [Lapidilactobacillus luobeiensis]
MISFGFSRYGDPSVLQAYQVPIPQPKKHQVQIRVAYFPVNPYDVALRAGQFAQVPLEKPQYLGSDLVGKVTALGAEVTEFAIGDWVIAHRPHSADSEFVIAGVSKTIRLPHLLDPAVAACLPTPGIAAYNAWFHFAQVPAHTTVAIIGVTGAVGGLLAQIAQQAGNPVIGVANHRHQSEITQPGLSKFVPYDQLPATNDWEHQATVVFNTGMGGQDHGLAARLVAPAGQIIRFNGAPTQVDDEQVQLIDVGYRRELADGVALKFWSDQCQQRPLFLRLAEILPATLTGLRQAHQRTSEPHQGKYVLVWDWAQGLSPTKPKKVD